MTTIKNIGKHYTFTDDSYWSGSGCDCCEDDFMEAYNCDDSDFNGMGTAHSEECIYRYIATVCGIIDDDCDDFDIEFVKNELDKYKITFSIVD